MPDDVEAIDQFIDSEGVPEFYADGYSFSASPYTINLVFTIATGRGKPRNEAIVRMSPAHAKMMAILFKKNLKAVEDQFGSEIALPQLLIEQHGIDLSVDW